MHVGNTKNQSSAETSCDVYRAVETLHALLKEISVNYAALFAFLEGECVSWHSELFK
jgi:hypothetical protein